MSTTNLPLGCPIYIKLLGLHTIIVGRKSCPTWNEDCLLKDGDFMAMDNDKNLLVKRPQLTLILPTILLSLADGRFIDLSRCTE